MLYTHYILDFIALIIIMLMLLNGRRDSAQLSQKRFNRLIIVIGLTLISDVVCRLMETYVSNEHRTALMIINVVTSLMQMLSSLFYVLYLRIYIDLPIIRRSAKNIIAWIPFFIEFMLYMFNFKFGFIFEIDPVEGYVRSKYFAITYGFGLIYAAYALIITGKELITTKDAAKRKNAFYMFMYMSFPILAFLAQLLVFDLNMTNAMLTISSLMIYLQVQQRHVANIKSEAAKANAEIEKTQALMEQKQSDFEELQRTNRTITYQKELLDSVYSTMNAGIVRTHIGDAFRSVEVMNNAAIELFGFSSYAEYNQNIVDGRLVNMDIDDADVLVRLTNSLQAIWNKNECDCKVYLKDGDTRILHIVNTLIADGPREKVVQSIIHDVTESRRKEEQKAKAHREASINEIFDILATDASDIYILINGENLAVEYVSSNVHRLTGITPEEIRSNLTNFYIHTNLKGSIYNVIKQVLQGDEVAPNLIKRTHTIDKEEKYFFESYFLQRMSLDKKILMVISDRTEDMKSKQALEEALHNAEVANKAKSDFLSDMSHDIRTPMNAIIGLIELLKEDVGQPENAMRHLRSLEMSGDHMLELVNNVLDMSRIEKGSMMLNIIPFNLKEVVDEVQAIYHAQASYNKLEKFDVYNVKHENLVGDMVRLKKILMNLLSNAVKYTNEGGVIHFEVEELEGNAPQGYTTIQFKIQDTGIGMSKEFIADMFGLFARERNTTTSGVVGTGLGMPIVKTLVDLMGGTIQVESEQGIGTLFTVNISFKLDEARMVEEDEEATKNINVDMNELKFLVVEDNPMNAEIILELLEMQGVICELAVNGQEAVEKFEASEPGYFDMILMDVQMPIMNGYEATRTIRESAHPDAKNISIVAMTANAFVEDVNNALEAGMNAHMAKPLKMDVLKSYVANLLSK